MQKRTAFKIVNSVGRSVTLTQATRREAEDFLSSWPHRLSFDGLAASVTEVEQVRVLSVELDAEHLSLFTSRYLANRDEDRLRHDVETAVQTRWLETTEVHGDANLIRDKQGCPIRVVGGDLGSVVDMAAQEQRVAALAALDAQIMDARAQVNPVFEVFNTTTDAPVRLFSDRAAAESYARVLVMLDREGDRDIGVRERDLY